MRITDNANIPHASALETVVHNHSRLRITCSLSPSSLKIEGDLDCFSLPVLVRLLDSIPGDGDIYVDLAGLEFIDVSSLRALVTTAAQLQDGHVLTLQSTPPQVRRLLDLTGWREAPGLRLDVTTPAPAPAAPCRTTRTPGCQRSPPPS
ncbi:hypothetical protein GCM10017673_36520 [Streptosporangium violaceochromogenes]|nr:hypothetical protein GCM10017673_36520 [Streptosporangium violaceochromogenes]